MQYYYLNEDQQPVGPLPLGALVKLYAGNILTADNLVGENGGAEWITLESLLKTHHLFTLPPSAQADTTAVVSPQPSTHSEVTSQPNCSDQPISSRTGDSTQLEANKKFVDLKFWNKLDFLTLLGGSLGFIWLMQSDNEVHLAITFLFFISWIPMRLVHFLVYRRCWRSLPKRHRQLGEFKAAYLLVIPIINIAWSFISLIRLVRSVERWEKEKGISIDESLPNQALILAASLSLSNLFIFSILGDVSPILAALKAGSYLASIMVGRRVFKSLVWRINVLRGETITNLSYVDTILNFFGVVDSKGETKNHVILAAIKWGGVALTLIVTLLFASI